MLKKETGRPGFMLIADSAPCLRRASSAFCLRSVCHPFLLLPVARFPQLGFPIRPLRFDLLFRPNLARPPALHRPSVPLVAPAKKTVGSIRDSQAQQTVKYVAEECAVYVSRETFVRVLHVKPRRTDPSRTARGASRPGGTCRRTAPSSLAPRGVRMRV